MTPDANTLGNCNCDGPGQPQTDDPITISTGNLFESVSDYATIGPNLLTFTRSYNSMSATANPNTYATTLGTNWRSNYDRYLNIASGTSVSAERGDGRVLTFTLTGDKWTPDSDVDMTLTNAGATWTLTDHYDTVETYTVAGSKGTLNKIVARNGYMQTLNYSASQLSSVTDSYGRSLNFAYSGGLLQTLTTPDGTTLTYGYSAGALTTLTSVAYSTTPATRQTYLYENAALPSALTGITDENGNRFAKWTYDAQGRGLSSQHAVGADLTTLTYNADGSTTVTNALGVADTYESTILQSVPKVTQISRAATATTAAATRTFTYDANGYVASQTDWNGNLTTYGNDVHGQPLTIVEASGTPQERTTTISYLANYHLPVSIVTPDVTTNFTYDASGELLTRTLVDTTSASAARAVAGDAVRRPVIPPNRRGTSRTWTYTWANFLLNSVTGPRTDVAQVTSFGYDGLGALTKITNPLGQITQITAHTGGGLPRTIIDPNGVTTTLNYSARQWLLTSTLSTTTGPLTTTLTYDAAGDLVKTTLPDGSALTNGYDAAHRLTGVTDLFKQSTDFTLDANGDRTESDILNSANAAQRKHSDTFDALGRVLHDIGGVGQTTAYAYDANGNALTVTDPLGHVTKQAFDPLNRLMSSTDAAGATTTITYDAHDRPLTVLDSNGGLTSFTYDGFGDVVQRISPDSGTTTYRYDLAGNLTQKVDATGATTDYTYDALNRPLTTTYPADPAENVTFVYDEAGHGFGIGRLTSATDTAGTLSRSYDERGNVLTEKRVHGTATLLTSTAFDAASRIASITYPSGWKASYSRDAMGRATAIAAQAPGGGATKPVISGVAYQPFGPVNGLDYGNGVAETRGFDLDYRLLNLTGTGKAAFQNLTYAYDAANNVSKIADGVTAANTQNLGYDVLDHLTSATGNYGSLGYTYSAIGNRLTQTSGGAVSNYTYTPDTNRLAAISTPASGSSSAMTFSVSGSIGAEEEPNWPSGTVTGTITAGSCVTVTLGQQCTITSINVTDSYSGTTITNPGNAALILYGPTAGVFAGQWGLSSTITNGSFLLGGTFQNSPGQPRSGWVYTTGPCPGPPTCNGDQYSGLYSITPLTGGSPAVTQAVTTTSAGNIASFTPAFGTVTNLTYNQANRLATVSGAGGQLTQYAYDAFGGRVVKVGTSTATTLYQYDRAGHLLEENDGLGTSRVDYVYLDDRPIATIQPSVGQVYFLHDDRLGTPQLATDANQTVQWTATYQPFGYTSTAVGLIVQDLRMPGQEFDLETGLYHNGFRDYAPGLGRYLESDPIGFAAGTADTYAYAEDSPVKFADPSGMVTDPSAGRSPGVVYFPVSPVLTSILNNPVLGYIGDHPNPLTDLPWASIYQTCGKSAITLVERLPLTLTGILSPLNPFSPTLMSSADQATQATLSIAPPITPNGYLDPDLTNQQSSTVNKLGQIPFGLPPETPQQQ